MTVFWFFISIIALVILAKPVIKLLSFTAMTLATPLLAGYYLFVPEQRQNAVTFFKVLALPVLIPLFPFIVAYKMRNDNPATAVLLTISAGLSYAILLTAWLLPS